MIHSRSLSLIALCAILLCGASTLTFAQGDATPAQRLEVMRSRLDGMRRSLNSAVAAMNAKDTGDKTTVADDPATRLRGLEQEVSSVLSEVNNLRAKQERAERVEATQLDKLETSVNDLNTRVQAGLQATASDRSANAATPKKKKKKGKLFGLFGGGGNDELEELTGTVAPGRDRVLFAEAATQVRKDSYDTGRLLFNTIITTYPDSPFLPLAKLAIADSFYLEGTSSSLIQAGAAYQDWLTFFPTDPLAESVMLKMAEAEMRQMGLADRDVSHARKAEQRLKVLLQQFPNTALKEAVQTRLHEVQENLGMHTMQIGDFYYERNRQQKGGLKGAQSRYREILEKYPNFSYMARVLFRIGVTYQEEEEPDEAAKFYQRIVRDYPNSEYAERAKEQLNIIGAEIPPPDMIKINQQQDPPKQSLTSKIIQEILGTTPVTVDKNGVIISKEGKGADLIDKALANGGQLPSNITPNAPVQRRAPARTSPQSSPAPSRPATNPGTGITAQPTQPGPPRDGSNPAAPATVPNTQTPANTSPATTTGTTNGTKP
ncbi:MAG TPA: outer membrane protein assembly factor BamD [Pyrinomonadaceae bacterium]|jgi:outer membrane protein assembly factor BamD